MHRWGEKKALVEREEEKQASSRQAMSERKSGTKARRHDVISHSWQQSRRRQRAAKAGQARSRRRLPWTIAESLSCLRMPTVSNASCERAYRAVKSRGSRFAVMRGVEGFAPLPKRD